MPQKYVGIMASIVNCQNNNPDHRPPSRFCVLAEAGGSSSHNIQTLTERKAQAPLYWANRRCSTRCHPLDRVFPEVMRFAQR